MDVGQVRMFMLKGFMGMDVGMREAAIRHSWMVVIMMTVVMAMPMVVRHRFVPMAMAMLFI